MKQRVIGSAELAYQKPQEQDPFPQNASKLISYRLGFNNAGALWWFPGEGIFGHGAIEFEF